MNLFLSWGRLLTLQICLITGFHIKSIQCEQRGFSDNSRYSYSTSFFDPNGKLGQVERAFQAASQGVPILVLARKDHAVMVAPHVMPSPFCDPNYGTQRFAQLTPTVLLAHSGITADGRVLMTAAQRLAIEHEYVFDEAIPVDSFLEEMSLLYQNYTMKEGVRPFGASLIVVSLSSENPQIYRIDPSGSVTSLGSSALVNGGSNRKSADRMKLEIEALGNSVSQPSAAEDLEKLVGVLQRELEEDQARTRAMLDTSDDTGSSAFTTWTMRSCVLVRDTQNTVEYKTHAMET